MTTYRRNHRKDGTELDNTEAAKIEVYRKLKPGEVSKVISTLVDQHVF